MKRLHATMVYTFGSDGQILLEIEDLTELHSDDGVYSWLGPHCTPGKISES